MTNNNHEEMIQFVERCRLFSSLAADNIIEILPHFEHLKMHAGDILFSQGDESDYLYILTHGELISYLTTSSGKTKIIGTINPTETVGELGALSGEVRSLTIAAVEDTELLRLPNDVFKTLCGNHPEVLSKISNLIIQRSIQTIKLMGYEKPTYNVSIVYPKVKSISLDLLREKFKHYAEEYDAIFLSSEDQTSDVIKSIKETENNNRQVIIFMSEWKEDIYKFCTDKLSHFYLLLNTEEKFTTTNFLKEVLTQVRQISNLRLELILLHPSNERNIGNTRKWLEIANFNLHHHVRLNVDADMRRLARFMTGSAIAVVLGGGGAKGVMHLGVIKALLEKGITIDAIGGTSIGATVGGCYVHTLNYSQTETSVLSLKRAALEAVSWRNYTWPMISLYSSNPMTQTFIDMVGNECIEDLWLPFFAVSSNLSENKELVHLRGMLWEAVRGSVAIPGVFPPFVYHGSLLFDGGLVNNLPVDVMRDLIGPKHMIIASSLARKDKVDSKYNFPPILPLKKTLLSRLGLAYKDLTFPPFFETFLEAMLIGSSTNEKKHGLEADILIRPNLTGYKTLFINEERVKELIDVGYRETLRALERYDLGNTTYKK